MPCNEVHCAGTARDTFGRVHASTHGDTRRLACALRAALNGLLRAFARSHPVYSLETRKGELLPLLFGNRRVRET